MAYHQVAVKVLLEIVDRLSGPRNSPVAQLEARRALEAVAFNIGDSAGYMAPSRTLMAATREVVRTFETLAAVACRQSGESAELMEAADIARTAIAAYERELDQATPANMPPGLS